MLTEKYKSRLMATDFSFLHDFEGLQFMPVRKDKRPVFKGWQTSSAKHDLSKCDGAGLVCGKLSGGTVSLRSRVKMRNQ